MQPIRPLELEDFTMGAGANVAHASFGEEARMTRGVNIPKKVDFSCEIISLIVLSILSALSHFWYILIAICMGITFWGAITLLIRAMSAVFRVFSQGRYDSRQPDHQKFADSERQVFQPNKIRQSVDC